MSESPRSPLARLVLFIVCLAIAGTVIALVLYFIVLPGQQAAALNAPMNWCNPTKGCGPT